MFLKLFGRKQKSDPAVLVPSGYWLYAAADLKEHFNITPEQADLLANDYATLLRFNEKDEFTCLVLDAGRDLHKLSQALMTRYAMNKKQAAGVPAFLANVAGAWQNQRRLRDLGISKCIWMAPVDHSDLDGQPYDPAVGLKTAEGYLLPGVTLGCKCTSRSVIPGLED